MILSTHGIVGSQIVQVDPDYLAFVNRVTTAGGSLSTTEQSAVLQLVLDLKDYGLWTKMKAVYPMVGASAAACAQNLKSSSFTGVFNGGWTFSSAGATPNGTSAFMNTNLNQLLNMSNTSQHLSYYSKTNGSGTSSGEIGITTGTSNSFLLLRATFYSNIMDSNFVNTAENTAGFYIGSRTSVDLRKGFYNAIEAHSVTTTSQALVDRNYYIGGLNESVFSNKECAFASIGDGLDDTEVSDFYTAVQAFQTTLSREV